MSEYYIMDIALIETIIIAVAFLTLFILYLQYRNAPPSADDSPTAITFRKSILYTFESIIIIIIAALVLGLIIDTIFIILNKEYGISTVATLIGQIVVSIFVADILIYLIIKYEKSNAETLLDLNDIFIVFFFGVQSNLTSVLENVLISLIGVEHPRSVTTRAIHYKDFVYDNDYF